MLRYQARISGPLLDRIDLQVEVPAVGPELLAGVADGEASNVVRERVAAARALDLHCALDVAASRFLQSAADRLGWSARGFHRILRIARTIADLAGTRAISIAHLGEAIQYRRVLRTH